MFALSHIDHHPRIWSGSVDASRKPLRVRGCFPGLSQSDREHEQPPPAMGVCSGNTGQPRPAMASAASSRPIVGHELKAGISGRSLSGPALVTTGRHFFLPYGAERPWCGRRALRGRGLSCVAYGGLVLLGHGRSPKSTSSWTPRAADAARRKRGHGRSPCSMRQTMLRS
jgi:hypothetical protein